ncbi:TPA: BlaI/MecI/CopY family transcriptional regulator [Clostridioides difficile]|uniref:BlaI/MecI/CopY family transcriptional regulator n=1 Tax=Clostridioides difficile TaxID=1496 RepID=UPI000BB18EE8|nr:BlaI/MecI/CopY family transcriptional regulator [Clostridioides difficile]EGT3642409.1 BlaI/MecI/CopY family transcriptional regulator [Clostridioides difficile]MBH7167663.1 BlaI/MecI/CopY family transcriptional regulator [Clostridioides difficile]MBH7846533.1 BlaI/MecI/CopY family transcriptional regulator [Clostridioides difficile]MBY1346173.1 BlaI/MecI/CopY family transcriptional regulator [Clostridioides difficile]MBY1660741.1 BlaI/MecI/CopY family transcriptional regulator [Clostridioi
MYLKKLSKSELKVMRFIWHSSEKVRSDEIILYMKDKYNWPEKITLKTLSKLSNKNFLYVQETNKHIYYTIKVKKEKYFEFISKRIHNLKSCSFVKYLLVSLCEEELTDEKLNSLEKWVQDWEDD